MKEKLKIAQVEQNKSFTHTKEGSGIKQSLRSFRTIQKDAHESPVRQEFKMLNLRQQEDPDTQYVMDYVAMGMKTQDLDNRQMSRKMVKSVNMTPVLHNSIRGEDPQFDQCWEDTIHGRATKEVPEEEEDNQEPEEPHANIEIKNDF